MPTSAAVRDINLVQRGVKLQHLRLIAFLHDTSQISGAAQAMNISQPAASRLASELERIIGLPLYTRHARGIELTDYGTHLALRAQAMLQTMHDAGREIAELSSGRGGVVTMGAVTGPALDLVLPVVKRMRVTHPKINISVVVEISDVMAQELLSSRLDFYIGRIPADLDPRIFDAEVIGAEPAALIVRNDHPLTQNRDLRLDDCVRFDWVMQMPGGLQRRTVEDYLIARGIPLPQKVLNTPSLLLTLAAVMETNAVAPVARAVAEFFGGDVGLGGRITSLPLAPDLTVSDYALIKLKDAVLSPAAQIFYGYLTDHFRSRDIGNEAFA